MTLLAPAFLPGTACRSDVLLRSVTLDGNTLVGYASVFNQPSDKASAGRWEQIAPTAYDATLADPNADPVALWNHDSRLVLGRRSAGTLELATDSIGLQYRVTLPDTSYAADLKALVARGEVRGSSYGFVPGKVTRSTYADGKPLVTHTSVSQLLDVSPVTYPAYDGTTVALRHAQIVGRTAREQAIRARARVLFGG